MNEFQYSYGHWDNEKDSVIFLSDLLKSSGLFSIYNEVEGNLTSFDPFREYKTMRIDMIALPKAQMINRGWPAGAIGIECKKSKIKINHAFVQAEDYSRTVWRLKTGFLMMCQFYFLWPYRQTHGFMASQMAQKRIGTLSHSENSFKGPKLQAFCGETKVFNYYFKTDELEIGNLNFGFKSGSR